MGQPQQGDGPAVWLPHGSAITKSRTGMPLLHDHLLVSMKAQRPDGALGAVHTEAVFENVVAASAFYKSW
ncbi:relaxase domain-containing protein [Streptomyces sp. NBC_00154]|uniref:relaxase domain-containing protein n=1 Tax=Streptomyces sp. NBC_00154 TaxID=2975670 RepID=UPI0022566190|nr:relaxase domain-containing protein [Streptomyces sp. NBC_00154]MCX5317872.1 relaxase domain-containing protein [Streptomyces sp. NBC_00154]